MSSARLVAAKVISDNQRSKSYSNIAADAAISAAGLSRADSALASMIIYGVLQRKITLDRILSDYSGPNFRKTHPFVLSVLRTAAYQLLFMDRIPASAAVNESVKIVKNSKQKFASGFVNAVLRKINTAKLNILDEIENSGDLCFKYSCTAEFADSLIADYGKQYAESFLKASLYAPKLYCRVNSFAAQNNLFDTLASKGITCEPCEISGAFSVSGVGSVETCEEFQNGGFFVQDIASQKAISALDIGNGMSVLDVCAAPGGKSFTAAQYAGKDGKIVSCDLYEKRVGLIASGAERLKFQNISAIVNDAAVFNANLGRFDRVICDVPCSGWGVIRRKPEIKYKPVSEFTELPAIQLKILETSVGYLKPNGLLMYSTCTLRSAENRQVVDAFLERNNGFRIVGEKTLAPHTDGSDGFYYCILKKEE